MNIRKAIAMLASHEDIKLKPYRCPAGRLTIGIGRNLDDRGITEQEAIDLCRNDIMDDCLPDLKRIFPEWGEITETRQLALLDMRFNLGPNRFREFKKMIAAVLLSDWSTAAKEATDSDWFHQVGRRGETVTQMLKG